MKRLPEFIFITFIIIGLWFLYGVQGNAQNVAAQSRSAIMWMVNRWNGSGGDLSHCWIIPLVSVFIIWRKRKEFVSAPKKTNVIGFVIIVLSLTLHWFGFKAQLTRLSLLSLIGLLWGIPFYLYGKNIARLLLFPCAYLVFCIPLSFLNNITVPLRIIVSSSACFILNGLGIVSVRTGTMISSSIAGGFNFDVADACSGLRSLLAITALTAAYAYFTQRKVWKQWLLFVMAVPLAIAGNIVRILSIALVAVLFGQEKAVAVYHDLSGLIVFLAAVLLMVGFGELIRINYIKRLREWKKRSTNNMS
ncbi:exosortase/archaeosortase family protein [Verrucomicrobiota bacterium]